MEWPEKADASGGSSAARSAARLEMNLQRLLERFIRYVQIDTTAREGGEKYPSSPGQIDLGRMLAGELRMLGAVDVRQNEYGIVTATLPPNIEAAETIAFNSHLDTSP